MFISRFSSATVRLVTVLVAGVMATLPVLAQTCAIPGRDGTAPGAGTVNLTIPADQAILVTLAPAGGNVAYAKNKSFLVVRKPKKLPPPVHSVSYSLEYGQDPGCFCREFS